MRRLAGSLSFARGDTASLSPFDGAYVTEYAYQIKPNVLECELPDKQQQAAARQPHFSNDPARLSGE